MTPTTIDLGILETGANRPELLGEFGTFADWFKALFAKSGAGLQATDYQCYLGRLPASAHAHDAYLITGSPASVNDPEAWISDLMAFVRVAAPARPIIGVCFGHQLLHKAFGGTVMANPDGGWGVGIHDYRIIAPALLPALSPAPSPATAQPAPVQTLSFIASHSEQVTSPAPGTVNLAASDYCPYAMTLIGDNILTVQAHPEATRGVAARIYEFRRDRLGDTTVNAAIASLEKSTDEALFVDIARAFIARRVGR